MKVVEIMDKMINHRKGFLKTKELIFAMSKPQYNSLCLELKRLVKSYKRIKVQLCIGLPEGCIYLMPKKNY